MLLATWKFSIPSVLGVKYTFLGLFRVILFPILHSWLIAQSFSCCATLASLSPNARHPRGWGMRLIPPNEFMAEVGFDPGNCLMHSSISSYAVPALSSVTAERRSYACHVKHLSLAQAFADRNKLAVYSEREHLYTWGGVGWGWYFPDKQTEAFYLLCLSAEQQLKFTIYLHTRGRVPGLC